MNKKQLINGLKTLLESQEDCNAAIHLLAIAMEEAGSQSLVETDSGPPESYDDSGRLWVTDDYTLLVDDEPIAEWSRCAVGFYNDQGEWVCEEDRNGDGLPEPVAVALKAFGHDTDYPDVPEPELPEDVLPHSPDGPYAVCWWATGQEPVVIVKYASHDHAKAVCEQRNRQFRKKNPCGSLTNHLCGYSVYEIRGEKMVEVNDDE